MFHGLGPEGNQLVRTRQDWTAGCIAISDEEIEDVFAMLRLGTPVVIYA
ncbi:murein L,D-transpeptidase [Paracoccus versutus]|nr:murein L,D-transpeptidase [Paracoccus versutus]